MSASQFFSFSALVSGKSFELKDSPEKERTDGVPRHKNKQQAGCSKAVDKSQSCKCDQQKTPTKSEQKALQKLQQEHIKSEQKAQLKFEKEQLKLEKEHQKEQQKFEKEQQKLEKEQQKLEKERLEKEQRSPSKNCFKVAEKPKGSELFGLSSKETPQLKSQKSIDVSCLKHQKSMDSSSSKQPARKSVDMQYTRDLLDSAHDIPAFSSSTHLAKSKPKK